MCKLCEIDKSNDQDTLDSFKDLNCCKDFGKNGKIELPMMKNLKWLTIKNNKRIRKIPILPELYLLEIHNCIKLRNIPLLPKLSILRIINCKNIREIPIMPELEKLKIEKTESNFFIPIQPKIDILWYWQCKNIIIRKQPNLRKLILTYCSNIKKIEKMDNLKSIYSEGKLPTCMFSKYPEKILFPKLMIIFANYKYIKKFQ